MRRFFRKTFSIAAPLFIAVLLVVVLLCFINRWDELVVITLIPMWVWMFVGGGLAIVFGGILKSRACFILFFLWIFAGVALSDATRSLGREFNAAVLGKRIKATENTKIIRIVSVNCREQQLEAALEAVALKPDIVFLQEAPEPEELAGLLRDLFEGQGSSIFHKNSAILARGRFEDTEFLGANDSTFRVRLMMLDGTEVDLANVHLRRSIPRFDLWDRQAWEEFTAVRIDNRKTLRHLVRYRTPDANHSELDQPIPLIVAGDFSTPPGDDIFRMLKKVNLHDAAASSQTGSINTFPSKFPLLRLDQIWHSSAIQPVKVEVRKNPHSDHKVISCDFYFQQYPKKEIQ